MIGCRAAAEAGSTDTFNAVPLYLVRKFIENPGEGSAGDIKANRAEPRQCLKA